MPIVYPNGEDGYVTSSQATWSAARDAITGTGFSSSVSGASDVVKAAAILTRGGGTSFAVIRVFMYFDFRLILNVPESATLNIYGYVNNSADVFVVRATDTIGSLGASDFDSIDGFSTLGVDNESNVTKYSDEITSWSTSGYNVIPLNATALKSMVGTTFYICLIESVHDLRNVQPSASYRNGMYFANSAGTSKDP